MKMFESKSTQLRVYHMSGSGAADKPEICKQLHRTGVDHTNHCVSPPIGHSDRS